MTEKEFRKLKTLDLIQILLKQSTEVAEKQKDLDEQSAQLELLLEENETIKAKLDDRDAMTEVIKKNLDESDERIRVLEKEVKNLYSDRQITLKETGSLVQAALELNKIFELAQREAEQYIYNVERRIGGRRFKALGIMEEFEELRQLERAITPITQSQIVQPAAGEGPAVQPITARWKAAEPVMTERQERPEEQAVTDRQERPAEQTVTERPRRLSERLAAERWPAEPITAEELTVEPVTSEEPAAEIILAKRPAAEPITAEELTAEPVTSKEPIEEPEEKSIEEDNGLLRPDDFKKLLEQESPQSSRPISEGSEPPWKREQPPKQPPEVPWKQQEAPPWPEMPQETAAPPWKQQEAPSRTEGAAAGAAQAPQTDQEAPKPQKQSEPSRSKGLFGFFRRKR